MPVSAAAPGEHPREASPLRLAALVLVALLATTAWQNTPAPRPIFFNFVAEHGNIAAALVRGEGFANPFGAPSGPTAWVPPVFPVVLAGLFLICGVKTAAALRLLLVLDCIWAATCTWFLLRTLELSPWRRAKPWLAAAVPALIWLQQAANGPWLSTGWFMGMLAAGVVWSATEILVAPSRTAWGALAVLCAVVPLSHAGLGLATLTTVLLLWWLLARRTPAGTGWLRALRATGRGPLLLLLCFSLPVAAWTVRNRIVFAQWIPLKSAGWYEVWLSETCTRDGVLTGTAVLHAHPYSDPAVLAAYTLEGEKAFLAPFAARSRALLAADPGRYLRFCANRALNVFGYCQNGLESVPVGRPVTVGDATRLAQAGFATRLGPSPALHWVRLDIPAADIPARIGGLDADDPRGLAADWMRARDLALDYNSRPLVLLSSLALAGLPAVSLLGLRLLHSRSPPPAWLVAAFFYVVSLLPNVLITHNSPHMLHYIGLHAFFLVAFAAALMARLRPAKTAN